MASALSRDGRRDEVRDAVESPRRSAGPEDRSDHPSPRSARSVDGQLPQTVTVRTPSTDTHAFLAQRATKVERDRFDDSSAETGLPFARRRASMPLGSQGNGRPLLTADERTPLVAQRAAGFGEGLVYGHTREQRGRPELTGVELTSARSQRRNAPP